MLRGKSDSQKFLETVAHERCPCGHLKQRHRKPCDLLGEVMGACRDCECRGLVDWTDDEVRLAGNSDVART